MSPKSRPKPDAAPTNRAESPTAARLRSIRTKARAAATRVRTAAEDVRRGTVQVSRRTAQKVRRLVGRVRGPRVPVPVETTRRASPGGGTRRPTA